MPDPNGYLTHDWTVRWFLRHGWKSCGDHTLPIVHLWLPESQYDQINHCQPHVMLDPKSYQIVLSARNSTAQWLHYTYYGGRYHTRDLQRLHEDAKRLIVLRHQPFENINPETPIQ